LETVETNLFALPPPIS